MNITLLVYTQAEKRYTREAWRGYMRNFVGREHKAAFRLIGSSLLNAHYEWNKPGSLRARCSAVQC